MCPYFVNEVGDYEPPDKSTDEDCEESGDVMVERELRSGEVELGVKTEYNT